MTTVVINPRVMIVREAISRIVPVLAGRKIKVTQAGSQAFCQWNPDGSIARVNLPYLPDDASDELITAVQGFLDHEVGHALFTDPQATFEAAKLKCHKLHNILEDPFIERKMADRYTGAAYNMRATGQMYLCEKVEAALKTTAGLVPPIQLLLVPVIRAWSGQDQFKEFMKDKWALVEDFTATVGEDLIKKMPLAESSWDTLEIAKEIQKRMKDFDDEEKKGEKGEKGKKGEKSKEKSEGEPGEDSDDEGEGEKGKKGKKSKDGKDRKGSKGSKDQSDDPSSDDDADPESSSGRDGDDAGADDDDDRGSEDGQESSGEDDAGDSSEERSDDPADGQDDNDDDSGRDDGDDAGDDESAAGEDGEEAADDEVSGKVHSGGSDKEQKSAGLGLKEWETLERKIEDYDEAAAEAISVLAAKSECPYLVYTRDHDVVETIECPTVSDHQVSSMENTVDHMVAPMQKDLERAIAARSAAVWTGGHKSGRLHGAALVRIVHDRTDLFRRKQENVSKSVAVSLVNDMSGSMTNDQKLWLAMMASYALSSTLERIGIKHEVIGFTTKNMSAVAMSEMRRDPNYTNFAREEALYLPILKGFDERINGNVKKRFAGVANYRIPFACQNNVDGESIQMAAYRLAQRPEKRKVMIVLSDGMPAANCPAYYRSGGDILSDHLTAIVKEVQKAKIDVVGIGINSFAVQKFYPKSVVLTRIDQLPIEVMRQLKALLVQ